MAANEQCATGIATSPPFSPNVQILSPNIGTRALDTCLLNKGKLYVNVVPTLPVLIYTYRWSDTPSSLTDTLFNASSTQIYTVTVSDNLGCSVTASSPITTTGSVTITGLTTTPQLCTTPLSGSATVVHPKTNPPYLHIWTDANGIGVSTDSVAMLAAGTYTIAVTDISGCIATQTTVVQPPLYPTVRIAPAQITLVLGDSVQLAAVPTAQEAYVYAWSPVAGLACYTCKKPMARPLTSSAYTVTITNAAGCTATASAEISIDKQYNVYIPNIITPNNDGANDNFIIHANSSVSLIKKISIFDRWGEQVYANQNIAANSDLSTWDGTFKGREVNNGVFVYVIEVEYVDGTTEIFKGDVTVAR
jgi:gliding motility-associated-like protein